MSTTRLEAFSDAVIAIVITVMVLELPAPHGDGLEALRPVLPVALSYLLSFVFLAIYWNNHHHMLQVVARVDGRVLWANMHLLFWLSLVPFTTGWLGETRGAPAPTAVYGVVLIMAAIAYSILQAVILRLEGPESTLRAAIRRGVKEKASIGLYAAALGLALVAPGVSIGLYVLVALMWLVPDRRIENLVAGG